MQANLVRFAQAHNAEAWQNNDGSITFVDKWWKPSTGEEGCDYVRVNSFSQLRRLLGY